MESDLIVKSNKVIEAGYELSTNEQRLILLGISRIPKEQDIDHTIGYEITAQEFAKAYRIHSKTAYRELKEAASRLYDRSIIVRTEQQIAKVRWVSMIITDNPYPPEAMRDENWKRIVIFFSPQIIPYLSNIKANFTQYLQSDISSVSGAYTIRFYELICQYRTVGKREISIKDLRFMLNLEHKYRLFSDLRRWVIEPSIKEINEKTPMCVSYELTKQGKTIVSILLKFKQRQKDIKTIDWVDEVDANKVPKYYAMSGLQLETYAGKLADSGEVNNLANVGEKMPEFKQRLRQMLSDPNRQHELHEALAKVGFVPTR